MWWNSGEYVLGAYFLPVTLIRILRTVYIAAAKNTGATTMKKYCTTK
jgi:hypothetical protein